jgi:hypothetical protein
MRPSNPDACIAHIRAPIDETDRRLAVALIDLYAAVCSIEQILEASRLRHEAILNLPITADEVREAETFLRRMQ